MIGDYLTRLETYLGNRYSPHTRGGYLRQARQFLTACGTRKEYSRDIILAYVDALVRHGYEVQTINVYLAGVRAMFRANTLTWPVAPRDLHIGIPETESEGPTFTLGEVGAMIAGAKKERGVTAAAVALSTMWGLRNTEIAAVLSSGVDGCLLRVQTAKVGRMREHRIPAKLREVLTFTGSELGRDGAHAIFDRVMKAHVRQPRKGEGWHATRRSLVTALVNAKADRYVLSRWMGWKVTETAFRYFRPTPLALDEEVYSVHPYLPLWLGLERVRLEHV
jgi:hypothetical protein